ncbi:MAG: NERD domain-containing protein [Clostridiales bacterium]|nr:NERD domain-containing protein [Clostridiales bacterium]
MPPFVIGFLVIVAIVVIAILLHKFKQNKRAQERNDKKGAIGERVVSKILGETIPGEQYVINDLSFYDKKGASCQIDHVFINKYGIWVIETKNYSGMIFGDENAHEWTQVCGNQKRKFYSPIKQNATHIYRLAEFVKAKKAFRNVVVFLQKADLSNVTASGVYSVYDLKYVINQKTGVRLSRAKRKRYYKKLIKLQTKRAVSKEEHIGNIEGRQKKLSRGRCPRCGAKLVLRNGKNGAFYGCSNYPSCTFTKSVE